MITDHVVTAPQRIQRQRTAGWRKPANTIYVGRPSRYGNPWKVGEALARTPAIGGADWEPETRISAVGRHDYHHPDGRHTVHHIRLMTATECVETFRHELARHGRIRTYRGPTVGDIREHLAGHNLSCWCPTGQPCHADVLLHVAAGGQP